MNATEYRSRFGSGMRFPDQGEVRCKSVATIITVTVGIPAIRAKEVTFGYEKCSRFTFAARGEVYLYVRTGSLRFFAHLGKKAFFVWLGGSVGATERIARRNRWEFM